MGRESDRVTKLMKRHATKQIRQVVGKAHENLIDDNPKDTQWSASNWVIRAGRPFTGLVGSKEDVSYAVANSSKDIVKSWDPFKGAIYITNHVPYMDIINAVHAPGFIENAVKRAVEETRR